MQSKFTTGNKCKKNSGKKKKTGRDFFFLFLLPVQTLNSYDLCLNNRKHRQFCLILVLSIQVTITRWILRISAAASYGETQANPKFKHRGLTWCPTWSNIPRKPVQLSNTSDRYFRYLHMATHLLHIYAAQLTVLLWERVTLHIFWSQTLCPIDLEIDIGISHSHILPWPDPRSCSWSAYSHLLAVSITVIAAEHFCSLTQSKGLKARSAQFILHW